MSVLSRFRPAALALVAAVALSAGLAPTAHADDVLVFAAASLKNALDDAVAAYGQKDPADTIKVSYGPSSGLAQQIDNGAPADIFVSADPDWMNDVQKHNMIETPTRFDWLGNLLVLVEPADSAAKVDIKPGFPLASLLGDGHLAMADPDAVPAGKYGKAALQKLGVWDQVSSKVAPAQDVRAALLYVSRKEVPFGIVYQTDAASDTGVKVAGYFPPDSYPPIVYPIALTTNAKPAAAKFLAFLHSAEASPSFTKQGFSILTK